MKRTYEKKSHQPIASVKPTTLNLQTRGFALPQTNLDEEIPRQSKGSSSANLLEKLISNPSSESSTEPIQRKSQNRLKASQAKISTLIQAKLNIGEPNDKYEKEADDTASKVVQQINSSTQDQSVQKQESMEEEDELQMKPISKIQRQESMEEENDELQMKSVLQRREKVERGEASTDLESSIQSARGSGQSLDANLQAKMGQAMGADFSSVKVHTDSQSDQLNKSIQAKAFTTGQDVFFRQGAYEPSSRGGQELIAHELTHVVQQQGSQLGNASKVSRKEGDLQSVKPPILNASMKLSSLTSSQDQSIQRLSFENTEWEKARTFKGSDGGGGGVLFISDGDKPLVVKPNGDVDEELMASHIHGHMREVGSQSSKTWKISGLHTRFAAQGESENIINSANVAQQEQEFTQRTIKLLGQLSDSGQRTMIQEAADGEGYGELLQSNGGNHIKKGSERRFGKKDKIKKDSALKPLIKDPSFAIGLGRLAAADIFLGNTDRIVGKSNLDNMLMNMGSKTINPIDNFDQLGNLGMTNKPANEWLSNNFVQQFIQENYEYIANEVFELEKASEVTGMALGIDILTGFGFNQDNFDKKPNVSQNDRPVVANKLTAHMDTIKNNFILGLMQGRAEILSAGIPNENSGISVESINLYQARFFALEQKLMFINNPNNRRGGVRRN